MRVTTIISFLITAYLAFIVYAWLTIAKLHKLRNCYIRRGGKTLSPEELDEEIKSRR
jgi:hypothetical protein